MKMKNWFDSSIVAVCIVIIASLFSSGCDVKPEHISAVARTTGTFVAAGWIALDNPDPDALNAVSSILEAIKDNSANVQAGQKYGNVIRPVVNAIIDKEIPVQYRAICKLGVVSLLGGLDMLFATHPEWKENTDTAMEVVNAFIDGAETGLGLPEDHEIMQIARANAKARAKILQ